MTTEELNNAKKVLNILKNRIGDWYNYTDEALDIIREYLDYNELVDEDMIDQMIIHEAESGGFQRVLCFLGKCESLNPPYGWMLDGYGNLKEVTLDDITMYLEETIDNNN